MTKKRRELTPEERKWQQNLRSIWARKKVQLALTQERAAELMGISQSAAGQYLNGIIPLNTDAKLQWAKVLQEPPGAIDPALRPLDQTKAVADPTGEYVSSAAHLIAGALKDLDPTPATRKAFEAVLDAMAKLAKEAARPVQRMQPIRTSTTSEDVHRLQGHDLVTYSDYEPLVVDLVAKVHGDGDAPREDIEALAKVVDLVKRRAMSRR